MYGFKKYACVGRPALLEWMCRTSGLASLPTVKRRGFHMRTACLALALIVLAPLESSAIPKATAQHGAVPIRESQEREDTCHLRYYNVCSEWTWTWGGYCYGDFVGVPEPPMYGTCFDLADCYPECAHLTDVWWACKSLSWWGSVDVEIFHADANRCPIGSPLAGIYGYGPRGDGWHRLSFQELPLCGTAQGETPGFIVMITDYTAGFWTWPYSDHNEGNVTSGCEDSWRCNGHSYIYRNAVSYCDIYGEPGPLWIDGTVYGCTNTPEVPPDCHTWYGPTGYYSEWLIDCYVGCLGATETEEGSWSQIKAMYR